MTISLPSDIRDSSKLVGFVGDPNGRGTASLVISCLLTLILCVWSALHLNVPHRGESRFQSLFVYARWILAGVYAPELVVFTAWRQWSSAKLLGKLVKDLQEAHFRLNNHIKDEPNVASDATTLMNNMTSHSDLVDGQGDRQPASTRPQASDAPASDLGVEEAILRDCDNGTSETLHEVNGTRSQRGTFEQNDSTAVMTNRLIASPCSGISVPHRPLDNGAHQCIPEWTMTHDFFASTGGFAFEFNPQLGERSEKGSADEFLPAECPRRLTLTARGMALLARCGQLPNVAKAEISDKSKANDLAKALVMIQASWMLVQVIARLIARLPVTLLEVNTIAHV